jgi:hypothetical protein
MSDIVERLKNPMMTAMAVPDGSWHSGTSIAVMHEETVRADMLEAAAEIVRLRAQVFGQGARLDQLHSIVGAAMAEPLTTFADIKKEIRNG